MECYGILMPNSIQSQEYSKDGDKDGILYITDLDGNLNVFNVEHDDDGRWLNTNWFNPQNVWNPHDRWVFARSRNSFYFPPPLGGVLF